MKSPSLLRFYQHSLGSFSVKVFIKNTQHKMISGYQQQASYQQIRNIKQPQIILNRPIL